VVAQLLLEAFCCFIVEFGVAGGTAALSSSNPLTDLSELSTSENRKLNSRSPRNQTKQLFNCAVDGCYTLTFRTTDYCWKHQDEPPLDPDPEPEPEQESNWWEEKIE
tara:strand:+ start:373 stop:693 length:321 start_codon:yes stop_codon:yes gene_type:complete